MTDRPNILTGLTNAQVLAEIEDVLRTMPDRSRLYLDDDINHAWLGRAAAAIGNWGGPRAAWYTAIADLDSHGEFSDAPGKFIRILHQAQNDLRMKTVGPVNVAVGTGQVFAYMDTIRKLIQEAKTQILFVDRYVDGDFVSDYLPHVSAGVEIRILARRDRTTERHLAKLFPMARSFSLQYSQRIQIRTHDGFHDRFVMIDGLVGYGSSCSFKDGPRTAGATITQHDHSIFLKVKADNEALWVAGTVEL